MSPADPPARRAGAWPRLRRGAGTTVAVVLVWAAATVPGRVTDLRPSAVLRLPVDLVVVAALLLVAPPRTRRAVSALVGLALGLVLVLRLLDLAFLETLDRRFDPVFDWGYLGPLAGLVVDSVGRTAGIGVLGSVVLLVLGCLVALPWSVLRLGDLAAGHRRATARVTALVLVVAGTCAALDVTVADAPVATTRTSTYAAAEVRRVPTTIRDDKAFARATTEDPLAHVPADRLLTGLRGKDVLLVFVESYGRVAVDGSSFAAAVDATLDSGSARLARAGFGSRSAFLTSPTYGGISWLAHSTLQSGLWVDDQRRYATLLGSSRTTLASTFRRAGWRTVSDVPADTRPWAQGSFYGYDRFYDARDVGYAGPRFGYPTMPDQYTLEAFHRLELARRPRRPVMAEIDLVTSHAPWSRVPRLLPSAQVGDGSVFDGMPEQGDSKRVVWRSPERVQQAYGSSIRYSLDALVSFVLAHGGRETVVVFLGDHQPAGIVSGPDAGHDVPVTVVAGDPAVLDRIAAWGWTPGLRPRVGAPVWRMDAFRDRFLAAFGPGGPH